MDRRSDYALPSLPSQIQKSAAQRLRQANAAISIEFDFRTAAPAWIATAGPFLTGPQGRASFVDEIILGRFAGDPTAPLKAFLESQRDLFGYGADILAEGVLRREHRHPLHGLTSYTWEQQWDGIPVFEGLLIGHVTANGELVNLTSRFLPNPGDPHRQAALNRPRSGPEQAILRAGQDLGFRWNPATTPVPQYAGLAGAVWQSFVVEGLASPAYVRLVWLPLNRVAIPLAYEVLMSSPDNQGMFRVVVDAQSGRPYLRQSLTHHLEEATFRVFTGDSPTPLSPGHPTPSTNQPPLVARELVTLSALDTNASPAGWITQGTNTTVGNNARAHLDRNSDDQPDLPRPIGNPYRVFDFNLDLNQNPTNHGPASVTQLFYWCNWMHDMLYRLGFTESAGNFQIDNFGRGGFGNDGVEADAQNGGEINNAKMTTLPDGLPARMEMYLFTSPTPYRDSDLDAEVILHEYTHGLSNRRVGGGVGLMALQSQGLGEGWSDFYALALLSASGDNPNGTYAFAAYSSYFLSGQRTNYYFGIRRYPYCTDTNKNPLTFKDLDPNQASLHPGVPRNPGAGTNASQIHRQGEIWCSALWEIRANFIAQYGAESGNLRVLQLVTDALTLTPPDPNFIQARDAVLQADQVLDGGANREIIWKGFAKRGLGVGASSPPSNTTLGVIESFAEPDNLQLVPDRNWVARGPAGGPFLPATQSYQLLNLGTNPIPWRANSSPSWLNVSPVTGVLNTNVTNHVIRLSLTPDAFYLPPGLYSNVVRLTNLVSTRVISRTVFLQINQPDPFTEWFQSEFVDISHTSLTFTPDGSIDFYSVCREAATEFAVNPANGSPIFLTDDGYATLALPPGRLASLYGFSTNILFIGSNGYITLGSGDNTVNASPDAHFNRLRVAPLWVDLDPSSGGTVSWQDLGDRVTVTYLNVPIYNTALTNSFQVEFFADGRIRITWLDITAPSPLVGLSRGQGSPIPFLESDLSRYESCLRHLSLQMPDRAKEGQGILIEAATLFLNPPPSANLRISLMNTRPEQLSVPPTLIIPPGIGQIPFDVEILDDTLWDGLQVAHVVASALDYSSAIASIEVEDNEVATLTLSLPTAASEGDSLLTGSVMMNRSADQPVRVRFESEDTTEILVPTEAIIPRGTNRAALTLTVVDDATIDGDQTAPVVARVEGWPEGRSSVLVRDNESLELVLTAPTPISETDGFLPDAAEVRVSGILLSNVTVSLLSSDLARLSVPATVQIAAGAQSATFDLVVSNNDQADGNQSIQLTATAAGWTNGVATVLVVDDETPPVPSDPTPPHLATQVSTRTTLAWQVAEPVGDNLPETLYEVYLGLSPDLGPADLTFTTTNLFWSPPELLPLTTYYWQVVARRLADSPGPIWQFSTRGVDHFAWDPIAPRQAVDTPFTVGVHAKNEFGATVSNFTGAVTFTPLAGAGANGPRILISEVDPGTPDAVEFVNVSTDTIDIGGWRVWIYDDSRWPDPAVTFTFPIGTLAPPATLFRMNEAGVVPGAFPQFQCGTNISWVHELTSNPIAVLLQDAEGKVADFVCAADAFASQITIPIKLTVAHWSANPVAASINTSLSFQRYGNQDQNSGMDWVLAAATPSQIHTNLVLPFPASLQPVPFSPTNSGAFLNGSWAGSLTAHAPVSQVVWQASDSSGRVGRSNPVNVYATNDLVLETSASSSPVVLGSNLVYAIEVFRVGPNSAQDVRLTNTLPAGVVYLSAEPSIGSCLVQSGDVICQFGDILPGVSATVDVTVTVTNTGFMTNLTRVASLSIDPDLTNNVRQLVIAAVPVPVIHSPSASALALEGNLGTNALAFTLLLSNAVAHPLSVDFYTAPGTAAAGLDYLPVTGTLIFPPGTVQQTILVPILGDAIAEATETFNLILTNAVGADLLITHIEGLILNDDIPPALTVTDATVQEGDQGDTNAVFEIRLSLPSGFTVAVSYQTLESSATAFEDYTPVQGVLEFDPGVTNWTIAVPVRGDMLNESDESFFLSLGTPVNATIARSPATGLVLNDDPLPELAVSDAFVDEPDSDTATATFFVTLRPASGRAVTVAYRTEDESALAAQDYEETTGSLVFDPGVTNLSIQIPVHGDDEIEEDETFLVRLLDPDRATLFRSVGRGTILNDDDLSERVDHFVWSPVDPVQSVFEVFPVRIDAINQIGEPADRYAGSTRLRAFEGGHEEGSTLAQPPPIHGSTPGPATVGYAFTPTSNLLVTHVRHGFGSRVSIWSDAGELLGSCAITNPSPTWTQSSFDTPIYLAANRRYRVGVWVDPTDLYDWSTNQVAVFAHGLIHHGVSWPGDDFPWTVVASNQPLVDLYYLVGASRELPVNPTASGSFSNGFWAGSAAVGQPSSNVVLWAGDEEGHTGLSAPFAVEAVNDLSVTLSAEPSIATLGQTLTLRSAVTNSGPMLATNVVLQVELPEQANLNVAFSSQGTLAISNRYVIANLGELAAGLGASLVVQALPTLPGIALHPIASLVPTNTDLLSFNNSAQISVPVIELPAITAQPENVTVTQGTTASFRVSVSNTEPTAIQWYYDGQPIPGETNLALVLTNTTPAQNGAYYAAAEDSANSVTSRTARLTVNAFPAGGGSGLATLTVTPGYSFVANILPSSDNRLAAVLPSVPPGCSVILPLISGYRISSFLDAWSDPDIQVHPGEGFVFHNPLTNKLMLNLSGKPLSGPLTNALPGGLALISSVLPDHGLLDRDLGFPAAAGDMIFLWQETGGGFETFRFRDTGWTPREPLMTVGKSFYALKDAPALWVQTANNDFGAHRWHVAPNALQGAVGQFSSLTYNPDPNYGRVLLPFSLAPVTNNFAAQFYGSDTPGSPDWMPLGAPLGFESGAFAGWLQGTSLDVPGSRNAQRHYVQLRVWETAAGSTYEEAATNQAIRGISAAIPLVLGAARAGTHPGLPPPPANTFPSFALTSPFTNTAPLLEPLLDHIIHAQWTIWVTNVASDAETPVEKLTFSLEQGPPGSRLDPTNGLFHWTPSDADAPSTNRITVRVVDDGAPLGVTEQSFQVTVLPRPTLTGPVILNGLGQLSWSAAPGTRYEVDYKEDLADADWTPLPGIITASDFQAILTDDVNLVSQRFYRIRVLP